MFTPKDKLADWFEAYASLMELNVWTSTTISDAQYDDASGSWSVNVRRGGDAAPREMHPRHIVLATGHSGEALAPSFPGQDSFKGRLYHASAHQDASDADVKSRTVVVVGTGNSGHDICQNYCDNGAHVTMLQRGGTYVISASKGVFMLHKGQYDETGPPTADADVFGQSLPIPVQFTLNTHGTARITETDKEMLDGLDKAGFKVDLGPQDSGIFRKYMTRGGGYYINVGCSELIAQGKIKVKQSEGIARFEEDGIVLKSGEKLAADVVVLATGYDNMRTTASKILGKEADRMRDVWDLNQEGELNAVSAFAGHSGRSGTNKCADEQLDVAMERTPWRVVYRRKPGAVQDILAAAGAADQGVRRRAVQAAGKLNVLRLLYRYALHNERTRLVDTTEYMRIKTSSSAIEHRGSCSFHHCAGILVHVSTDHLVHEHRHVHDAVVGRLAAIHGHCVRRIARQQNPFRTGHVMPSVYRRDPIFQ